jgi:DNA-binding MarR family transcriptional regulator
MAGNKHDRPLPEEPADPGRFAYEGLERVMHEKARLGMLTSLMANPSGLLFGELKELCSLTDGNLNRHLKVLQEAALIEVWKGTKHNRPQTLCRITSEGRKRFLEYIEALERVIADAALAAEVSRVPASKGLLKGFSPA